MLSRWCVPVQSRPRIFRIDGCAVTLAKAAKDTKARLLLNDKHTYPMRPILLFPIVLLGTPALGQITLEHTYEQGSSMMLGYSDPSRQFLMVNLEQRGHTYVIVDRVNRNLHFYDLDHNPSGSVSFASATVLNANVAVDILYISQHLFDLDDGVEFIHGNAWFDGAVVHASTQVIDDDGSIMFSADGSPLVKANFHQQQYPIYSTPQGTKLILSMPNGDANVYSLAGTFTAGVTGVVEELSAPPYPNPTTNDLYLPYTLPENEVSGTLEVLDALGNVVRSFNVNGTSKVLHIETGTLASGSYTYRILTASGPVHGLRFLKVD